EAQPTVGSSMIPFAASARNKQQISRGPVVPSGLDFSNTLILLDEYEPVGFASRPPLEILQRTSNEVCVDDCCRPMVQRTRLRCLRLRVGHPHTSAQKAVPWLVLARIIMHNCGNFSVALMAIPSPLLLATLTHGSGLRPRATPQGAASAQLPATRLANRVTLQPKWIGL